MADQLWGPADVVYLAVSVVALGAGLFPELLLQPDLARGFISPPALQVLLAAQAGLLILFCPLLLARRRAPHSAAGGLLARFALASGEFILLLIASLPLYWAAAWFGNAAAADVVRGVLYLVAVAVATWGLSLWAVRDSPAGALAVSLASALIVVAAPVSYYLLAELTRLSVRPDWLWSAAPVTCAFSVGASRGGSWYPAPLWAWALWPIVGVALTLARLLAPGRPGPQDRSSAPEP